MFQVLYLFSLFVLSTSNLCEGERCSRNARIAGGEISVQNSRPYQVALYSRVGTTGELGFCSGSLIDKQWVLTAAHCCFHNGEEVNHVQVNIYRLRNMDCLVGLHAIDWKIVLKNITIFNSIACKPDNPSHSDQAILGAHSLYDRYEHGRRVVNIAELVIHPEWDPETFHNDIALLRLANTIQLTDTINTVLLPYRSIASYNLAGFGAVVSGWGIAAEGVTFVSPTLRQKLMTVITDSFCNTSYANQLPDNTICAFYGAAGTCKGDNGGPMTIIYTPINEEEGEELLVGVASFISRDGCNDDVPSVFTRVQRYLDWISQVTGVQIE